MKAAQARNKAVERAEKDLRKAKISGKVERIEKAEKALKKANEAKTALQQANEAKKALQQTKLVNKHARKWTRLGRRSLSQKAARADVKVAQANYELKKAESSGNQKGVDKAEKALRNADAAKKELKDGC